MLDTLWGKAISAQQRIREIDEGIVSYETKVLEEDEKKTKRFKGYLENSNQLSVCTQDNRLQFVYNNFFKVIEQIMEKSKNGEHKGDFADEFLNGFLDDEDLDDDEYLLSANGIEKNPLMIIMAIAIDK